MRNRPLNTPCSSSLEIALVNPPYRNMVPDVSSIPLGLAWLSSWLKLGGFRVRCFDFSVQKKAEEDLIQGTFPIICIQLHSEENFRDSIDYVRYLKKVKPSSLIIAGGIASTLKHESVISESSVDILVLGEGEITLRSLLDLILKANVPMNENNLSKIRGIAFKCNNRFVYTGRQEILSDLNRLPLPDRDAFPARQYKQWSVITARGCPHQCSFCTIPVLYQGHCRVRSAESIYAEIKVLRRDFGVKEFLFLDDTFTVNKDRVMSLCQMLLDGNFRSPWSCLTRADSVDMEILEALAAAGCRQISYGIESINQKTLDRLNKRLSTNEITAALESTANCGIRRRTSFIFGLPGETYSDILTTIDFICDTLPEEVQIYPLMPYSGIPILEDRDISKVITLDQADRYKKNAFDPLVSTYSISKQEIQELLLGCIEKLKSKGYYWVPGDVKPGRHRLERVVMTEFCPAQ